MLLYEYPVKNKINFFRRETIDIPVGLRPFLGNTPFWSALELVYDTGAAEGGAVLYRIDADCPDVIWTGALTGCQGIFALGFDGTYWNVFAQHAGRWQEDSEWWTENTLGGYRLRQFVAENKFVRITTGTNWTAAGVVDRSQKVADVLCEKLGLDRHGLNPLSFHAYCSESICFLPKMATFCYGHKDDVLGTINNVTWSTLVERASRNLGEMVTSSHYIDAHARTTFMASRPSPTDDPIIISINELISNKETTTPINQAKRDRKIAQLTRLRSAYLNGRYDDIKDIEDEVSAFLNFSWNGSKGTAGVAKTVRESVFEEMARHRVMAKETFANQLIQFDGIRLQDLGFLYPTISDWVRHDHTGPCPHGCVPPHI